jgi:hypothetical protein
MHMSGAIVCSWGIEGWTRPDELTNRVFLQLYPSKKWRPKQQTIQVFQTILDLESACYYGV